jgi:CRP-like cAMP-binding protein
MHYDGEPARRASAAIRRHSTVTSALLPVLILGFVLVSYIALRPFSVRVRHAAMPLLQEVILFEALEAEQLAELAAQLKPRSLEPGEVLFAQGGTEAMLFIIAAGILQIHQHTELSGDQTASFIGAGEYIGEVSLLTGAPYAATATARTHCKLYGLDCTVLKPLLAANSGLYAEFDRSARRGLAILNRVVAVRATDDSASQSLLHRFRAFFDGPR